VIIATHGQGLVNADSLRYRDANNPAFPGVDRQRHGCEGASEWIRVGAWDRRVFPQEGARDRRDNAMGLPRVRFPMRQMMVVVAIVPLLLGTETLQRRRDDFLLRAEKCDASARASSRFNQQQSIRGCEPCNVMRQSG